MRLTYSTRSQQNEQASNSDGDVVLPRYFIASLFYSLSVCVNTVPVIHVSRMSLCEGIRREILTRRRHGNDSLCHLMMLSRPFRWFRSLLCPRAQLPPLSRLEPRSI